MADVHSTQLLRVLSTAFGVAVVVGGTIGQGIMRTPGLVAQGTPQAAIILALWVFGGVIVLIDAMSSVELAASMTFVSLGARYQIEGTRTDAVAGYSGGSLGLVALGAQRARMVGTAAGGIAYRLPSGLDLFASAGSQTGRDDHQESMTAGLRLRF